MSGKPKDITGQRFGRLVVMRLMDERRNKRCVWECLCDCGRLHYPTSGALTEGKVMSCGCLKAEKAAEIGKIYAPINSLRITKNLIGKRFGRLKVIEETDRRRNNKRVWKCLCDCGQICYASGEHLCRGNTRSCGCLGEETALQNHEAFKENRQLIDGTAVTSISKMTLSIRNKTGVRGVFWDNRRQCYTASITFKRQTYYLGRFSDLEEAKKVRQAAEEKIFGEFCAGIKNPFLRRRAKFRPSIPLYNLDMNKKVDFFEQAKRADSRGTYHGQNDVRWSRVGGDELLQAY